jgi:hypothetical protein
MVIPTLLRMPLSLLLLIGLWQEVAEGQVKASERGISAQTVDGTVIEVEYGRPALRGRIPFGGVIHWGEMWTPGANFATTVRFSRDVKLGGSPVAAGKYSIWLVPAAEGDWTFYLHRDAGLYHLQRPRPGDMFLALRVKPAEAAPVERLTWSFPEFSREKATLRFQWGPTALSLEVAVRPTIDDRPALSRDQVAPYVGEYAVWLFGEGGDSTDISQRLTFQNGRLRGAFIKSGRPFELIPTGKPHEFWFESHDATGPVEFELASTVVFTVDGAGRATGFTMKAIEQPLWMRGTRIERQ